MVIADNEIGAEGAVALAAVLPQMASLTTLDLFGTGAMHGALGFVFAFFSFSDCVGLGWSVLRYCAGLCGRALLWAAGIGVRRRVTLCGARSQLDRRRGRGCVGGGAAADGEPHDA